jgi:hypothetical protein
LVVETKVINLAFEIVEVDLGHRNAGNTKSCTGAVRQHVLMELQ